MEGRVTLRREDDGPVRTLTIDRPDQRNSLNGEVLDGLLREFRTASQDDTVRVVVLTGAGDRAFCAGADLSDIAPDAGAVAQHEGRAKLRQLFAVAAELDRPLVGRVNGHALAGGLGVALLCDLLVAADDAQFGTPEVRVGLWPYVISRAIADHVGPKRALELMMTGRRLSAEEAVAWGLVNRVVPRPDLDAAVGELVSELLAGAPLAQRLGRRSFYSARDLPHREAMAYLQGMLDLTTQTEDVVEGITAFFEKREPRWRGR